MPFHRVHRFAKIGIKRLTDADKGLSSSNQTHIGLFEETISFAHGAHKGYLSKLIYGEECLQLLCLLDYIENPDGTFRSPKIRTGEKQDFVFNGRDVNTVVRKVREIVSAARSGLEWYLLWVVLENEEFVFFLFENDSDDFTRVRGVLGEIKERERVGPGDPCFAPLLQLVEVRADQTDRPYLEKLEDHVQSETYPVLDSKSTSFDFERAKALFAQVGRKGEELVAVHFEKLKQTNKIRDYNWLNAEKESYQPYDFTFNNLLSQQIFVDVKSTNFGFPRSMFFSDSEIRFISRCENYHVFRVYEIGSNAAQLRRCTNLKDIMSSIRDDIAALSDKLARQTFELVNSKIGIPPTHTQLRFEEVELL